MTRLIVPVPDKDPRRQLGEQIQRARVQREMTHREIAERCGVAIDRPKFWEEGAIVPDGHEWARLKGSLWSLQSSALVWRAALDAVKDEQVRRGGMTAPSDIAPAVAAAVKAEEEAEAATPSPTIPDDVPPPPPLPTPSSQTTFGPALRIARLNLGLTQEELAQLLDVSPSTISRWETEADPPVLDNWNRLVGAMPELRNCAPPGVRNIDKPGGPRFPRAPTYPGRTSGDGMRDVPPMAMRVPTPILDAQDDAVRTAGIAYARAARQLSKAESAHTRAFEHLENRKRERDDARAAAEKAHAFLLQVADEAES